MFGQHQVAMHEEMRPLPPGMEDEEQKKKKKQSDVTTTTLTSAEKLIVSKTGELKNQLARRLKKANAQTALEFVERRLP